MAKQYNADLFVKNGGLSTEVLMADGGVSPSSDFVNENSTFLPINTDGEFTDSPFYTLEPAPGFEGFGGIGTKSAQYFSAPSNVPDYNDFGLEIKSYLEFTADSSVSIGDYAQSINNGSGEFYWYTGAPLTYDASGNASSFLPFGTSGIIHNSGGYNLLNITNEFFKIDAKTGSPSRVDGLLFNLNSGIMGFGRGLDANSRSSYEASIVWDIWNGGFKINDPFGNEIFFSQNGSGTTYIQQSSSKLGLEAQAMYISDDLVLTSSPTTSTKVLNVRDVSGNSYQIKLYVP